MLVPISDSLAFLTTIFAPTLLRCEGYLLIWQLATKRSAWFHSVEEASQYVLASPLRDTYVCVGLSAAAYGDYVRIKAHQAIAIAAFWLDIDIQDAVHQHADLPPDLDGAWQLIADVGHPPTAVVHTGHGLQAWWRIHDGVFASDAHRVEVAALVRDWQRRQIARARARYGWRIDATFDLARLMRVPGSWNCKAAPVPVRLEPPRG
jgi:putative DNA primase/helicase